MDKSKALVKIDDEVVRTFDDATEQAYGALVAAGDLSTVQHALEVAAAIQIMRRALTPEIVRGVLQPLAGTTLGFQTDRDSYPDDVIRDCAIEAVLNGLPLVGNRWNVIGGRFYVRKEGFEDLCGNRCRFSAQVKVGALPANAYDQGGYVTCSVTVIYRLHDAEEDRRHVGTYRVRLNKKSKISEDLLEGKAKRKALRDLWRILSGTALADADDLGGGNDRGGGQPAGPSDSRPDPESPADRDEEGEGAPPAASTDDVQESTWIGKPLSGA